VRIAVKALGLNRAEAMFRMGQYLEEPRLPARLGYEAAGMVEAIGEGVPGLQVGDAVSTILEFSVNLIEITGNPERLGKAKRFIVDGLASGKLKPVIAKTFSGLDQIVEAHRYMESNRQVGKIVVTI
jgi:NADPH:quinone reductase-like Zn-dependent oxidoreductase